jgi:hypothetical protein
MLGDSPDLMRAALRYIERHRQMQLFGPEGPKPEADVVADFLTELRGAP